MKKLLLALILFFLASTQTLLPPRAIAASPNTVGVGPILVETPPYFERGGIFINFEMNGATYHPLSSNCRRYPDEPCVNRTELPTPNNTDTVTIKVASIQRTRDNGTVDRDGYFVMTQGIQNIPSGGERDQSKWTWSKSPREEIGTIKFEWKPTTSPPQITLDSPAELQKDDVLQFYVRIAFPDPKRTGYAIHLRRNTTNNELFKFAISCPSNTPCDWNRADPIDSNERKYIQSPQLRGGDTPATLTFRIPTNELTANESYTILVTSSGVPDVSKPIRVSGPSSPNNISVQLSKETFTEQEAKTQSLAIILANGNPGSTYSITLNNSEIDNNFQCQQANCSRTIELKNYRLPANTYRITVTNKNNVNITGFKEFTILQTPLPTIPATPTPILGPECPAGCNKTNLNPQCGVPEDKPCGDIGIIDDTHTVLRAECSCSDGSTFLVCKDIGPKPECGAPPPTPTPFPCPVCPDDHPRWDPPGDLNGRCCEKDGKPGECKSPVPKIRKDDCEPGIPCGFGIGCGLGTRGPCGKKLDEKGNPTDAFTCDTAIGTFDVTPQAFVKRLFGLLLGVSGGVALLLILYSSYRLMMSRGDPEKLQGARETLTSAIVGLLFIIFSLVILEIVGVDVLQIPGLGR